MKHEHETNEAKFQAFDIDFHWFIENVKSQFNNINQVVSKINKEKLGKIYIDEKLNKKIGASKVFSELEKINKGFQVKLMKLV